MKNKNPVKENPVSDTRATAREWWFEWKGGGYNSCRAVTRAEAIRLAHYMGQPGGGMTVTLVPVPGSFTCDQKKGEALEKYWAGCCD